MSCQQDSLHLLKTWTWLGEEVIIQAVLISAKMNQLGTASTNLKTNDRENFCEQWWLASLNFRKMSTERYKTKLDK